MAVAVSLMTVLHQRQREIHLRDEEAQRQHRAQADLISLWFDDSRDLIWIENRSEQPIYEVAACLMLPSGGPALDGHTHIPLAAGGGVVRVLPPRHRTFVSPAASISHPVPFMAFRDVHGTPWERDHNGNLRQLATGIFERFGVTSEQEGYTESFPQPI
ncbi:hypothetical protein ACFWHW_37730 [Streptomyces pharetrae]|uniref:hypothetical protein n=1 Tax=Streptomyces pharetrae TaxID=291370 RepID=UPI00364C92F8